LKVGDICKIKAGMDIPADGVIIKATGVTTNESAMTGESIELKKESVD
jgi:P-type E1-E2 ATPase